MRKKLMAWPGLAALVILSAILFAACNIDGSSSIDKALGDSPLVGTWGDGTDDIIFGSDGKLTGRGTYETAFTNQAITYTLRTTAYDVNGIFDWAPGGHNNPREEDGTWNTNNGQAWIYPGIGYSNSPNDPPDGDYQSNPKTFLHVKIVTTVSGVSTTSDDTLEVTLIPAISATFNGIDASQEAQLTLAAGASILTSGFFGEKQ